MDIARIFPLDETPEPVYLTDDRTVCYRVVESYSSRKSSIRRVFQTDPREEVVLGVLPILDGFERFFSLVDEQHLAENETLTNWFKAIVALYRRTVKGLQKIGLEPIDTIGFSLDLERHEVVEVVPVSDQPTGTVVHEVEKGYILNGKMLRPAKVAVVKNQQEPGAAQPTGESS
ncbi:MAG TPA: nucleotide exchange factor GrpE [bacterium]|nr:nucleotide exchange factor GrpE [bacterium]